MQELLFNENSSSGNNNFHPGLNVTVRLGKKHTRLTPGENIMLLNRKGEVLGYAIVNSIVVCHLKNIPESLLSHEHDPTCRDLKGLYRCLSISYGMELTPLQVVTVVIFNYGG
jgi:hypothetical protein